MPGIRTIIQYFKDLLDVPSPSPGKYLKWDADGRLINADGGGGDAASLVLNESLVVAAITRNVPLTHAYRQGSTVVHVNSARQALGIDYEERPGALLFLYDLEPGDVVLKDYLRS